MGLVDLDTLVSALELIDAGDPRRLGDILVGMGALQAHELEKATQERSQPHAASTGPSNTGTLRVDIDLLDSLMNLAGELVLSRNQFKAAIGQDKHALSTAFSKLDLITNELQEEVTKTRLQPIGLVWRKLPRLVRDTAQACGKDVALTVSGEETELDRFLLDFLNDPMLHLIRNAIDHGIESPDERIQAGKPTQGAVTINAFYQNGLVNVQISDNGRGLHTDQLRTTAVEKGIVGREAASALTEHEAMHLMFRPGFSTAKSVTSISGRGVGLDVVKTNVESVGGTISIESTPGEGTCFTLRVPLTLAIIPALLASSGQNKFAIPLGHVVELIRIKQSQMDDKLSLVHDIPVIHHGADLVPLVHLDHRLSRRNDGHASFLSLKAQETANVIVVQSHDERFALLVDEMLSTQDIVAKPLDERLKGLQVFSGATILGTGEIALILDIHGVATWTQIRGNAREFTFDRSSIERENTSKSDHHPSTSLLVVGVGEEHRLALPMSAVHRVIKLETHTLEYSANQPVMQVDNEICPAMWLTEFLGLKTPAAATSQSIAIAIKASPKPIVLLADRLIDTVDCTLQLQRQRVRRGIKGSAVVAQKVTDIIDIEAAIQMAHQPRTGPEEHTT